MKTIPLTQGYEAIVDDEDFERVAQYKWCANVKRYSVYAYRKSNGKNVFMHRQIVDVPAGMQVDHTNGNGLDNRRCNLRPATRIQNGANRRPNNNNPTGLKGVFRSGTKWRARIHHQHNAIHLGAFPTPEDAARAYDAKAIELFGEFARTNFAEAMPIE